MRRCTWRIRPVLVMSLALSIVAPCPSPGQDSGGDGNLLPNPSFEESTPGGIRDWKSRAWSGEDDARWTVEATGRTVGTTGKTGKQCASIRSEKGADAAWTAKPSVRANTFYRLSGWIKTRDIRGAAGALINIQNLQHVKTPAVTGTRDWTSVSTIFHTGNATELEINCLFGGWGRSTGQAWYDDVTLEELGGGGDQLQAIVAVDTRAGTQAASPMLFGGFIEHFHDQIYGGIFDPGSPLSDEKGFRKDVIEAMKELKLSIVRWPGGCFASGYHWRDGVGKDRKPTPDPVWGVVDPNTFGTAEFVEWCRRVGCEPYICTNAGNGTPEEMQDWVAYCNRPEGSPTTPGSVERPGAPLGVRYWSIGNENWGGHEIGARTPQEWGPLVLESAKLMRAADPNVKLLAAATPDRGWTLPLLAAAGSYLEYVAIHGYWLPCWQDNLMPDYPSCIEHSNGPEETIAGVIRVLEESGFRGRIKIAFDEWNLRGWHHPGFPRKEVSDAGDPAVAAFVRAREKNAIPSQYTMADALFTASFLNSCLRHADDVGMANIAPIVNTRGPLYVHPRGILRRTTFHTLAMYANLLEKRVALTEMASAPLQPGGRGLPRLDAIATRDEAGSKWRLALTNRHPSEALRCLVTIGGKPLDGKLRATVLAGDSPEAYNDLERPDRVRPEALELTTEAGRVTLAPHSVTILEVGARAQTISGPLHNEDETDFFWNVHIEEGKAGEAIDRYVDVMADAGVKVFLCNTNARKTNYQSAVWEAYWDGYDPKGPDDQPLFASTPKGDVAAFRKGIGNMLAVHRQGIDYPARVTARCRARGMSPWISLRMNDCHYNDVPGHAFHGSFWKKNPQLCRKNCTGYFATCLDYANAEVRDYFGALVAESLDRWDIDGLELDFMREPYLFSAGKEGEGGPVLTAWLRGVRARTRDAAAKRGHPVRLGVRVPSRPETASAMGLEAIAWAKEGLIDLLVVTPRWATLDFDMPLDRWRELLGSAKVTLAGGLEVLYRPSPEATAAMVSPELAAGAAASVLSRGADAVYLFNYFQSSNVGWTRPVYLRTLAAMASLDALGSLPRSVAVTYRDIVAPGESYRAPLPATGNELSFRMLAGPAGDARRSYEIRVGIAPRPDAAQPVPLVSANGRPCTFLEEAKADGARRIIWGVPSGTIGADGICTLRIASPDEGPLTVRSVELSVEASPTGSGENR